VAFPRLRSGLALYARPPAVYTDSRSLAGGATVETLTVPGTAGQLFVGIFGYTAGGCFVRVGASAAAWTPGDTVDGTAFSCAPIALELIAGQVISFQCAAACIATVDYYAAASGKG